MANEDPVKMSSVEVFTSVCKAGGYPRYDQTVIDKSPFKLEICGGNRKMEIKLDAAIDSFRDAREIAYDIMLKSIYPEWELSEASQAYADTAVEELSDSVVQKSTQEAIDTIEAALPDKIEKIQKSDRDDAEKQRIITDMKDENAQRFLKFKNQGWPEFEEVEVFEDPSLRLNTRMYQTIEEFDLTAEWEYDHCNDMGVNASVTIHKKSDTEGGSPQFLFKVEHSEEFNTDQLRTGPRGRRTEESHANTRLDRKQRLMRRIMAESIVNELIEAGILEHADSAFEKIKTRRAENPRKPRDRKRRSRGNRNRGGKDEKKEEKKTFKVTKASDTKVKKEVEKRGGNSRGNRNDRKRAGGNIYREHSEPKYLNNVPYVAAPMYAPVMMQAAGSNSYYRNAPASNAQNGNMQNGNMQGQGGNMANGMSNQHSGELARLQQQQMQQMQALVAQQQAQFQQAQNNVQNRGQW